MLEICQSNKSVKLTRALSDNNLLLHSFLHSLVISAFLLLMHHMF